jgi:hypothetical protein
MINKGVKQFVEIGPSKILQLFVTKCGCIFKNPSRLAILSSTFGLYFIVQEPSG